MAIGQVTITVVISEHVGPKNCHGGVTLSFDGTRPYSFRSEANWPRDNYDSAVRAAVEEVLTERVGGLEQTEVILQRISWDEVDSSQVGFARAARIAAAAAVDS